MTSTRSLLRFVSLLVLLSMLGGMVLMARKAGAEVLAESAGAPSTVEALAGTPGDAQVTLTWNAATDDKGVEAYKIYTGLSSAKNGGTYNLGETDAGNTTTYTMSRLTNGVTYYFAVKAYDSDGNLSPDYSNEVEVTPESAGVGDFVAPTVTHASAVTSTLVQVDFSEKVALPSSPALAFSLEGVDGSTLEVLDAYVSKEDASTVFLVTAEQDPTLQYVLTAGLKVTDLAGNPIESGTSDTAIFDGSATPGGSGVVNSADATPDQTPIDIGFGVEKVEATEINQLVLHFSQKVSTASADSFVIERSDDASKKVEVLATQIDETDSTQVTLVTADMEAGYDYTLTLKPTILNEAGSTLPEGVRTVDFTAQTVALADVIPPEDVTKFLAKAQDPTTAELSWTASINSAGDLAKYLVYTSLDGKNFGTAITLDKALTSYLAKDLVAGSTYTFKVTAVDATGNESTGVLTTVKLPEAGPELLFLGALAAAGAAAWERRKKL